MTKRRSSMPKPLPNRYPGIKSAGVPAIRCSHARLVATDKLKPNPANPNTHAPAQLALYAKILRHQGWRRAVVVSRESGLIVTGHGAWLTAKAEGWPTCPVDFQSFKSRADETAHMIADNKLPQLAEFDEEALAKAIREELDGFDLDLTGLSLEELQELKVVAEPAEETPIDTSAANLKKLQKKWKTALGQLWELGEHRVLCGDSMSGKSYDSLIDHPVPIVVTSPPYNQKLESFKPSGMHKRNSWVERTPSQSYFDNLPEDEYQESQRECLNLWHERLSDSGSVFYNHKNRYRDKAVVSPMSWLPGPFKLRQEVIWSRLGSVTLNARMFMPTDERIFWMFKGDDFLFNDETEIKSWSTVWQIGLEHNANHAVGFPTELPSRCIQAASKEGDVVLDPFLGSGTTLIACENLKRRCRGIEISPAYVAVILERWATHTGKTPKLLSK